MGKNILNLEIKEIEQFEDAKIPVSLMPCPCGASGGGVNAGLGKFGPSPPSPWGAFWGILAPTDLNKGEKAMLDEMNSRGDDTTGSDADFAAINAEIEANESQAGGGGK